MLDPTRFLEEHWQKKPLLVRDALGSFDSPLTGEQLAGLALEDGVASRLILERGGAHPWELRLAPHERDAFERLPETHWTLLVHEVDRLVPAVGRLLEHFRFLPNWRLDDVMVSYAAPHGSVGAHLDHYDVFLLQGAGRRRWRVETSARARGEASVPDLDVRLLAEFEPDEEWVLNPGDMLYLPPRHAHHGIALDACLTYSIGFRAPHQRELAAAFGADLTERADGGLRYADPDLAVADEPGEIDAATLRRVRALLDAVGHDDEALAGWFGRFATEPKRERREPADEDLPDAASLRVALADPRAELVREAPCRFAHYRRGDGGATLFVGGEEHALAPARRGFVELLTGRKRLDGTSLAPYLADDSLARLLCSWMAYGFLLLEMNGDGQ